MLLENYMKKTKKETPTLRERLCHSFDISPDVFPRGTHIELRGRCSLTLRGCTVIRVYNSETVCFASSEGDIRISGQRLCCSAYRRGIAVVDGQIDSVSFCGRCED